MPQEIQGAKWVTALAPISINGTAATTTAVDCSGYETATFIFQFGTIAADTESLKLTTSDASGSGYSDISGTTLTNFVATTDNGKQSAISVDVRKQKRYIKPVVDPGAGATLVAVLCCLTRGDVSPVDATTYGLKQTLVIV